MKGQGEKMSNEFDFGKEFENDEEVESVIDMLVAELAEAVQVEDNKTQVVNFDTMQRLMHTYKVLKHLTKGTDAKVTYATHEPFKSVGSISIVGKRLTFKKPELFMKAVELSSNFEAYPKTDGTVQINFTFHGLTNPID